jgi:G protein beta subunit-like protein
MTNEAVILATAGYDRTIKFWDALSGICTRTIQHPDSQVNKICVSLDKKYLAAAGNPHTRIYECMSSNNTHVASLEGHTTNVTSVSFQSNGKWVVTGSEDGTIKIWDLRTRGHQREYSHNRVAVNDVIIHPNQGELISCDQNGSIKIWDLGGNVCTHELVPEDSAMRSLSIASDGSLLVAGNNKGNVYIWRMLPSLDEKGNTDVWDLLPITKIQAHTKYLLKSILSPDARFLATCSADFSIKLWSVNSHGNPNLPSSYSFPLKKTLTGHQRWVWDIAFNADSE